MMGDKIPIVINVRNNNISLFKKALYMLHATELFLWPGLLKPIFYKPWRILNARPLTVKKPAMYNTGRWKPPLFIEFLHRS
jgi:hypothetical protein